MRMLARGGESAEAAHGRHGPPGGAPTAADRGRRGSDAEAGSQQARAGVSRTTYHERKKRLREGGVTVLASLRKPAAHRFTSAGPPSRNVKLKQLLFRVPLSNGTTSDLFEPYFFEHRRVNPFHWQQHAIER